MCQAVFRYDEFMRSVRAEAVRFDLDDEAASEFVGGASCAFDAALAGRAMPSNSSSWWDVGVAFYKAHVLELLVAAVEPAFAECSKTLPSSHALQNLGEILQVAARADAL